MEINELKEILRLHSLWLANEPCGVRADLNGAELRGADLRCADLRCADLRDADLRVANLSGADLRGADLRGADLSLADLSGADLSGANLSLADLRWANLSGADLSDADMREAVLYECVGIRWADCSWFAHGERGRCLLAVEIHGEVRYFCGCFRGSEEELREYIMEGDEGLRASRLRALQFCRESF